MKQRAADHSKFLSVWIERVPPDYTWPLRVPLEKLEALVKLESREALVMAQQDNKPSAESAPRTTNHEAASQP